MSQRIPFSILMLMVGVVSSLNAAPTPTPTPTPKKSFLSVFKPRRNPPPTRKIAAGVGRGTHLGIDRSAQSPTPRPGATPKPKSSPTTARKSAPSQVASPAAAKSPTPSGSPSPQVASSPQNSPEEELPPIQSGPVETASPTPTPMPSATGTTAPEPTPTATITATPAPSISPAARPTKIEVTLTRFEPPRGLPGDPNYRSAQLSYRINVPNRMEYPTISFTVETSSGKLFERVVQLPPGSAFVEPGDNTEHTSALDPVDRADWASTYSKADRATFNWSIEGQSSGHSEMPVKKPWP